MSAAVPKPPVESIELHLDPAADAAVRALWDALTEAGVASMGRHGYNTPHITLAAVAHTGGAVHAIGDELAAAIAPLVGISLTLSGLGLFPHAGRSVLYASVVVQADLLAAHASLHGVLAA